MTLPEKDPDKADKWWYFVPVVFSILGGLIGYFVWRKANPKFAKRLLMVGLIFMIPNAIISSAFWYDDGLSPDPEPITKKFQYPNDLENKVKQELQTTSSQNQNYFRDTNGYTPEWAKNIGEEQSLGKCMNIFAENIYGKLTAEKKWCNEFMGFLGDGLDQQMKDMGSYTP